MGVGCLRRVLDAERLRLGALFVSVTGHTRPGLHGRTSPAWRTRGHQDHPRMRVRILATFLCFFVMSSHTQPPLSLLETAPLLQNVSHPDEGPFDQDEEPSFIDRLAAIVQEPLSPLTKVLLIATLIFLLLSSVFVGLFAGAQHKLNQGGGHRDATVTVTATVTTTSQATTTAASTTTVALPAPPEPTSPPEEVWSHTHIPYSSR